MDCECKSTCSSQVSNIPREEFDFAPFNVLQVVDEDVGDEDEIHYHRVDSDRGEFQDQIQILHKQKSEERKEGYHSQPLPTHLRERELPLRRETVSLPCLVHPISDDIVELIVDQDNVEYVQHN